VPAGSAPLPEVSHAWCTASGAYQDPTLQQHSGLAAPQHSAAVDAAQPSQQQQPLDGSPGARSRAAWGADVRPSSAGSCGGGGASSAAGRQGSVPLPQSLPASRPVLLPSPADMRRLASGRLPGGGARGMSADMQRAPSGRLPPTPGTLSGAASLRRGGSIVQLASGLSAAASGRLPPPAASAAAAGRDTDIDTARWVQESFPAGRSGRAPAAANGRGRSRGQGAAPSPRTTAISTPAWAGGLAEEMRGASTRLMQLSSIGENAEEGASSEVASTSDDEAASAAATALLRPMQGGRSGHAGGASGGGSRGGFSFRRGGGRSSGGGGLTEDMLGASSGLLAMQSSDGGNGSEAGGEDAADSDDDSGPSVSVYWICGVHSCASSNGAAILGLVQEDRSHMRLSRTHVAICAGRGGDQHRRRARQSGPRGGGGPAEQPAALDAGAPHHLCGWPGRSRLR